TTQAAGGLRTGMERASTAVGGLAAASRGGVGALQGLLTLMRVATGPIGLAVTAITGLGAAFLKFRADARQAAIDKERTRIAEEQAKLEHGLRAIQKASAESLQSQLTDVRALAAGYTELIQIMGQAQARMSAQVQAEQALA